MDKCGACGVDLRDFGGMVICVQCTPLAVMESIADNTYHDNHDVMLLNDYYVEKNMMVFVSQSNIGVYFCKDCGVEIE